MGLGMFVLFILVLVFSLLFIGFILPWFKKRLKGPDEQELFEAAEKTWHTTGRLLVGDDFVKYVTDVLHDDADLIDNRQYCVMRKVRHTRSEGNMEDRDVDELTVYRTYVIEFSVDGEQVRWKYETCNYDLCSFLKTVLPTFDIAYHVKGGKVSEIFVCSVNYN